MKLRNKKTGKIVTAETYRCGGNCSIELVFAEEDQPPCEYNSLAELCGEWEDYEKPKFGYIIDPMEEDCVSTDDSGYEESDVERAKELGIWFETEEECDKAVEKLKALTRLRNNGFKVRSWRTADLISGDKYYIVTTAEFNGAGKDDLDLLFGGEE